MKITKNIKKLKENKSKNYLPSPNLYPKKTPLNKSQSFQK